MRVNIYQEGTEKVLWYKERYLAEEEIVENLVDNMTSTIHWTIHKPVKGWYIRLRSPSFPPGTFISLTPPPSSSPYHSDAALIFSCRTNIPSSLANGRSSLVRSSSDSDTTLTSDPTTHSYPPTPPQNPVFRVSPPSPRAVQAKLSEIPLPQPTQQISTFILTPHSHAHVPEQKELSVFTRIVSALKNSAPSHSSSFTLSPLPNTITGQSTSYAPTPIPLLTYHDRTPAWKVSSTQGILEMDPRQERELGVHPSFYIAIALAYLDFLTERESYLAAAAD
ncbi:hypothetical protein BDY19DRAFT_987561 [Irpex rosettiformis]|uniref:Uncharacterized protein n=1 Tax=Irpex rosettiformis TaxID=378272 RepID=A0ACB8TQL1_9APHY|nr:hypothetical protein BDY19DRAFT_987561 [Irpex rosettiformis]